MVRPTGVEPAPPIGIPNPDRSHHSRPSDLERAAAAASLGDIRVVEDEPAFLQAIVEIDDGAVEVGVELLVHGELNAMDVDDAIALGGAGVEVQAVREAAAAPPLDADAKHGAFGQALVGDDLLDLVGGLFTQGHTHGTDLLVQVEAGHLPA